jgi:hypothetical protein
MLHVLTGMNITMCMCVCLATISYQSLCSCRLCGISNNILFFVLNFCTIHNLKVTIIDKHRSSDQSDTGVKKHRTITLDKIL